MRFITNNKGFSLVQAILVAAILLFVALSLSSIVEQMALAQKKDALVTAALNLQESVKAQLLSDASWEKTISHPDNGDLHCLINDTCTPPLVNKPIKIIGANNQVLFDGISPTAGFTSAGVSCANFDETHGNNDCPLRLEISASIQCDATATSCPKQPLIVSGKLHYKPSGTSAFAFNPERFNFTFTRLAENLVKTQCSSLSGTYDSTTGNCALNTVSQCPSGQYVNGFASDGKPSCAALPPAAASGTVTPNCGPGKEVSTIDWSSGTYTCKTTIAAAPPPPVVTPPPPPPTTGAWHQGASYIPGAQVNPGGICTGTCGSGLVGKTCKLGSSPVTCGCGKSVYNYICY